MMKKSLLLSAAFAMVLGAAISAIAGPPGVVVYDKPKNGAVTFDHGKHSGKMECAKCHQQTPPEKIEINKDAAHGAACKDCHTAQGGPTKCGDCHQK
jgi:hypothetical protein